MGNFQKFVSVIDQEILTRKTGNFGNVINSKDEKLNNVMYTTMNISKMKKRGGISLALTGFPVPETGSDAGGEGLKGKNHLPPPLHRLPKSQLIISLGIYIYTMNLIHPKVTN